jgi:hypothetical protein
MPVGPELTPRAPSTLHLSITVHVTILRYLNVILGTRDKNEGILESRLFYRNVLLYTRTAL